MPNPTDAAELKALFEEADAARKEAEAAWGAERLPLLVGTEWRVKLRRQQARLSAALQEAYAADRLTGEQMQAVRDAAAEAGHRPLHGDVLGERLLPDGSVVVFVRDNDSAAKVIAEGRACAVYTLDELAYLIGSLVPESLAVAKIHFPGAKFTASSPLPDAPEWIVSEGDPIPFGEAA
jgi:streptogramin lyase